MVSVVSFRATPARQDMRIRILTVIGTGPNSLIVLPLALKRMQQAFGGKALGSILALFLLTQTVQGQDVRTTWFEFESNVIAFGDLDPEVNVVPHVMAVRVHSDTHWALKLIPNLGILVETGDNVPLDRLQWRLGSTGPFLPLDTSGPLTITSGAATGVDGELILVELLMEVEETDPIGQYRFDLRMVLENVAQEESQNASKRAFMPPPPGQSDEETVTVTANLLPILTCGISASFDFGDVDLNGTDYLTPNVVALGRNVTNTGGEYENRSGSIRWICRSFPPRFVNIALVSTTADHSGGMNVNDLEVRIPGSTRGGRSTGYQAFTSQADLITGMVTWFLLFPARGQLDVHLTVLDTDAPGPNAWVVRLRATSNP